MKKKRDLTAAYDPYGYFTIKPLKKHLKASKKGKKDKPDTNLEQENKVVEINTPAKLTPLKILITLLYALIVAVFVGLFIMAFTGGTDITFAKLLLVVFTYGSIAFGSCVFLALLGVIILCARKKKKGYQKKTMGFFITFIFLPIFTEGAIIAVLAFL